MSSKFDNVLELIESLSVEEQERIIEIVNSRLLESKRRKLVARVIEGKRDIKAGRFTEGKAHDIMKAIYDKKN
ncbi:MAG TPA: hypothetical protein PKA39_09185 [Ignavibacteria bacterium]|jgi:hypothetical protein|nr:hypothetical protein [Ignavibacteria bacterium]